MALEEEQAFFVMHRDEWVQHYRGQFALIYGQELLGTYTLFNEAFEAGVQRLGNRAFLVRKIVPADEDQQAQFPALVAGVISAHP